MPIIIGGGCTDSARLQAMLALPDTRSGTGGVLYWLRSDRKPTHLLTWQLEADLYRSTSNDFPPGRYTLTFLPCSHIVHISPNPSSSASRGRRCDPLTSSDCRAPPPASRQKSLSARPLPRCPPCPNHRRRRPLLPPLHHQRLPVVRLLLRHTGATSRACTSGRSRTSSTGSSGGTFGGIGLSRFAQR